MNREYTNTRLAPTQVITIYNDKKKHHYYLEHRQVKEIGGKLTMLAATPMEESVFQNIAASYIKAKSVNMSFDGLIPEHMLYGENKLGKTVAIWYRPAMKRSLNFSGHLGIAGEATVSVPATLYIVINTTLYVFALVNDRRPDLKTKLYRPPFYNIYADGNVCLGTARIGKKASSFEKEAERFERAFYMAEQNGGQSAGNCKTPLSQLWNQLIKSKAPFPSDKELVQHAKYPTLGEFITKAIGTRKDS